jgi:hypothetical protein
LLIINIQIINSDFENLIHKSAIAEGQRIYYNFIKQHQWLKGKISAKKAGLILITKINKEIIGLLKRSDLKSSNAI